jgi:hypothetical protein
VRVALWLLVGAMACRSVSMQRRISEPQTVARLNLARLRATPGSFDDNSGLVDSVRAVVRDSAAWHSLWAEINRPFIPPPALPSIDFDRDIIVVAALGARPTGGYGIMIEGATEDSSGIEVSVVQSSPGHGCALSAARTEPVDLARISVTKRPVRFRERTVVVPCGGR